MTVMTIMLTVTLQNEMHTTKYIQIMVGLNASTGVAKTVAKILFL